MCSDLRSRLAPDRNRPRESMPHSTDNNGRNDTQTRRKYHTRFFVSLFLRAKNGSRAARKQQTSPAAAAVAAAAQRPQQPRTRHEDRVLCIMHHVPGGTGCEDAPGTAVKYTSPCFGINAQALLSPRAEFFLGRRELMGWVRGSKK